MAFDSLFQPVTIGTLKVRNRIVKSPNTTAPCNPDGTRSAASGRPCRLLPR